MNKLTLKGKSWMIMLLAVFAFTACDDDDDDIVLDELTAQEFVNQAAVNNLFEIETSNLALQNAETEEVEQFAEQMIEDHTTASAELTALASSKGIAVPTTLPQEEQATRNRLAALNGIPFDKDYMTVQVEAHEEAVALFQRAVDELDDAELRFFAEQTLPILEEHLVMARELKEVTDEL